MLGKGGVPAQDDACNSTCDGRLHFVGLDLELHGRAIKHMFSLAYFLLCNGSIYKTPVFLCDLNLLSHGARNHYKARPVLSSVDDLVLCPLCFCLLS